MIYFVKNISSCKGKRFIEMQETLRKMKHARKLPRQEGAAT